MLALLAGPLVLANEVADVADQHPVVGRYSVVSDAGGAVWAFQAGGSLVVSGPADLIANGSWSSAELAERAFDASLDVGVTGQELTIVGEVSPDHGDIAMHVAATEPSAPELAAAWPSESRLVGDRLSMAAEPSPSVLPEIDCLRPSWDEDGTVDWDPCAARPGPAAPSAVPSPAAG